MPRLAADQLCKMFPEIVPYSAPREIEEIRRSSNAASNCTSTCLFSYSIFRSKGGRGEGRIRWSEIRARRSEEYRSRAIYDISSTRIARTPEGHVYLCIVRHQDNDKIINCGPRSYQRWPHNQSVGNRIEFFSRVAFAETRIRPRDCPDIHCRWLRIFNGCIMSRTNAARNICYLYACPVSVWRDAISELSCTIWRKCVAEWYKVRRGMI